MRLWKAWIVARKELLYIRKNRRLVVLNALVPLFLSLLLPFVIYYELNLKNMPVQEVITLMGSFGFYFVILAALLPIYSSVSSIVLEKQEKSLEPVLATPTSDSEILMGKNIAAFLPTLMFLYLAVVIMMILMDLITAGKIGYLFYPNWTVAAVLLLAVPFACVFSTAVGIFTSSRATNIQSAQTYAVVPLMPLVVVYLLGELGIISLNSLNNILLVAAGLFLADILVIKLSISTFSREEILTRWR